MQISISRLIYYRTFYWFEVIYWISNDYRKAKFLKKKLSCNKKTQTGTLNHFSNYKSFSICKKIKKRCAIQEIIWWHIYSWHRTKWYHNVVASNLSEYNILLHFVSLREVVNWSNNARTNYLYIFSFFIIYRLPYDPNSECSSSWNAILFCYLSLAHHNLHDIDYIKNIVYGN